MAVDIAENSRSSLSNNLKSRAKIALIGCGRIGWLLENDPLRKKPASHWGAIQRLADRFELTAICDNNQQRLTELAKISGATPFFDYKKLIKSRLADFIIVAVPTILHYKVTSYAIKSGVKGIILEKPVASNLYQAKRLLNQAAKANLPIVVNHERRYDPLFIKIKEIITRKIWGELKSIFGRVYTQFTWPAEQMLDLSATPLIHDGTHLIDLIRFLGGEVEALSGWGWKTDKSSFNLLNIGAVLELKGERRAFLEFCGQRDYFHFELDLFFERARIRVGNGIKDFFVAVDSKNYSGFRELEARPFEDYNRESSPFCGALIDLYQSYYQNMPPISSLKDAVFDLELLLTIIRSMRQNSRKIRPLLCYN